jgi:RND family efflux transporter MFP subunit
MSYMTIFSIRWILFSLSLGFLLCLPAVQAEDAKGLERESLAYTDYTLQTELFVEFKALVVGEPSSFAAHLTKLKDFSALTEGKVIVTLSGGGHPDERFEASPSQNPGIFRPIVKPVYAGERQVKVAVQAANLNAMHVLGLLTVYPSLQAAPAAQEESKAPGVVLFLKEQQWQVAFATALVDRQSLRASLPVTGVLRAPANAETTLTAPSSGTVLFAEPMPMVGHQVKRGQLLASIVPRLAERGDMATLTEETRKTQLRHDLAHKEHERTQKLMESGVIAARQTLAAQTTHELTHAELDAAQKRLSQYRQPAAAGNSGIPLNAPQSGIIAQSFVGNGRYVEGGDKLFQLVDRSRLWLEARVPEADLLQIRQITGASFTVDGLDERFEIKLGETGQLVSLPTVVDSVSRTLPVVFELNQPDPRLPLQAFARVRLFTGQAQNVVAIPESAVVDDNGNAVAFIQTGGESFQRRMLKLGVRDQGLVEVKEGLSPGERIVTKGAYLVYLAATAPGAAVHGHVH